MRISPRQFSQSGRKRYNEVKTVFHVLVLCSLAIAPGVLRAQSASFSGLVSTVGNGFSGPTGAAVDASGDVFVADFNNNAVKEIVAVNGVVTRSSTVNIVGHGFTSPFGVALDANGDLFVADFGNNAVKEIIAVNGQVSSTSTVVEVGHGFSQPQGVALDSKGDVLVADYGNSAVKEIVAVNGQVSSQSTVNIVGSGFGNPGAVAVDSSGDVFVADSTYAEVDEIVAVSGQVSSSSTVNHVGGSGNWIAPTGVALDSHGDVFVAVQGTFLSYGPPGPGEVQEILAVNGLVSTNSTVITLGGGFGAPSGVGLDAKGNVFVADALNNDAYEISFAAPNFGTVNVGSSATLSIPFAFPSGGTLSGVSVLTEGAAGLDFTAARASCNTATNYSKGASCSVTVQFSPLHAGLRTGAVELLASGSVAGAVRLSGIGSAPQVAFTGGNAITTLNAGLSYPFGVAVSAGGAVFVADAEASEIKEIPPGCASPSCVLTVGSGFSYPRGVAIDGSGNVYVADSANNAVKEIVAVNGQVSSSSTVVALGSGFYSPYGVAVDPSGDVFVADTYNSAVKEIVAANGQVSSASTVVTLGGGFGGPEGVALDASGDVFVADTGNAAVKEIMVDGSVVTVADISAPVGVTVDAAGDVFVSAAGNDDVKEIPAGCASASCVMTVAGGFQPDGLALDGSGNLFVIFYDQASVQEIPLATPSSLSFASTDVGSTSSDSPQSVTIQNIGNAQLNLSGLSVAASFAQVPGSGSPADCSASATLAPGSECNLSFSFTPQTAGPISGAAVLTDNALNGNPATESIPLSGTGLTPYDAAISMQFASTQLTYPGATNITVCIAPATNAVATGTVQIDDGTTPLATVTVQGNGCAYWYIYPGLTAGTHQLSAVYSGDKNNPAGNSMSTAVNVAPVPVNLSVSCWNSSFAYGANYQCSVTASSNAGSALGVITYTVDGGAAAAVSLSNGNATFSVPQPAVGQHSVVIAYAQQTNYAAAGPQSQSFTVTPAAVNVQLTPSPWSAPAGSSIAFTAAVTSPSAGAPGSGSVSFYDGPTLLGMAPVNASGQATYSTNALSAGSQTITATYSGGANYVSGSGAATVAVTQ